jgi:signal transduction histidine kinase
VYANITKSNMCSRCLADAVSRRAETAAAYAVVVRRPGIGGCRVRIHVRDPGGTLTRARRDPPWILTLLAVGGALAVTVILTGTRLLVPAEQVVIPSSNWVWTHEGVTVEPVGPSGGVQRGDIVVAMNGVPLETWAGDAFRLPWLPRATPPDAGPDRHPTIRFEVRRGGDLTTIEAPRLTFPPNRAGAAPIGLVAFGVSVLVLALVFVVRRPRVTALRLLLVGAAANLADIVAWELDLQPTDLAVQTPYLFAFCAAAVFNLIFWSSIAHILTIYPVRSEMAARNRYAIPALYAAPIAALAIGLLVARLAGGTVLDWIGRWAAVQAAIASGMIVVIMAATVAGYRRTREPRRRQVRWIALALGFAAVATMGLLTLPIVLTGHPLAERNTTALLALPVPIALALAVIRDRLFQIDLLARSRGRIVAAREEERRRLRRDLHDGLGPTLAAVGLKVDLARERAASEPGSVGPILDEIRGDIRSVISDVRRLARELRPPTLDSLGLAGAIRQQASALSGGSGPSIVVEADEPFPVLPAAVEVVAYRIAIEAMTNAVRHAEATMCRVRLLVDRDGLIVQVTDDGVGIDPAAPAGVGLHSIDERAAEVGGEVDLHPRPGGGTIVRARLPLTDDDTGDRRTEDQ